MENKNKATKILALQGSPRKKGNSITLAEQIVKGAESVGAAVEKIYLHDKDISPCQACYACQRPDSIGCAIDDEMQPIYNKLIKADCWIIASPVYWFSMSAQTKLFMDRCFALPAYKKDAFAGKRIAIAMSYGDTDAFRYVGANLIGMVYGSAEKPGEIKSTTDGPG